MNNNELITFISSNFVIIPIVYYLKNRRELNKSINSLFFYLLFSFLIEQIYTINYYFVHSNLYILTISFFFYEVVVIYKFQKKYLDNILNKLFVFILFVYGLLVFSDIMFPKSIQYEVFSGGNKIIILLLSINGLLASFNNKILNWHRIVTLAFLQYAFLGVVIFSFVSFFIENKEYIYYFVLLNSISNILLYLILTYSMYICKKRYLQA